MQKIEARAQMSRSRAPRSHTTLNRTGNGAGLSKVEELNDASLPERQLFIRLAGPGSYQASGDYSCQKVVHYCVKNAL